MRVDISQLPEVIDTINAIVNNNGTAEIKLERNGKEIVVVETSRSLRVKQRQIEYTQTRNEDCEEWQRKEP